MHGADALEDVRQAARVEVLGGGEAEDAHVLTRKERAQHDPAIDVRVLAPQERALDDAEDGARGADADGDDEDDDRAEARSLAQHSQTVTNVLEELVHASPPSTRRPAHGMPIHIRRRGRFSADGDANAERRARSRDRNVRKRTSQTPVLRFRVLTIRAAAVDDRDAIWSILEPVLRA